MRWLINYDIVLTINQSVKTQIKRQIDPMPFCPQKSAFEGEHAMPKFDYSICHLLFWNSCPTHKAQTIHIASISNFLIIPDFNQALCNIESLLNLNFCMFIN